MSFIIFILRNERVYFKFSHNFLTKEWIQCLVGKLASFYTKCSVLFFFFFPKRTSSIWRLQEIKSTFSITLIFFTRLRWFRQKEKRKNPMETRIIILSRIQKITISKVRWKNFRPYKITRSPQNLLANP